MNQTDLITTRAGLKDIAADARSIIAFALLVSVSVILLSVAEPANPPGTIIWKLEDTMRVGGFRPLVLGAPLPVKDKTGTAILFNGVDDGLIVPVIPIENWSRFTVEVLFKPATDGPGAPRFVHFQDKAGNRGTIELRLTPRGWYLDTFLRNGKTEKGLTLIDSTNLHPADRWYWAALVYDGKKMFHYVNAVKELEGVVEFGPMGPGEISLGVRLNRVNWYKGLIREIRFHPNVLAGKALQRR